MADLTYDTKEAVPEDLREHAEAKDGKFVVGVTSNKKLAEFRDNNTNLSRERDGFANLIGRLKTDVGFDPEKVDEFVTSFGDLRTIKEQVDNGKLIKDTSLDEAVTRKTGEMQRQHASQVQTLTTNNTNLQNENATLKQRLDDVERDNMVGEAASLKTSGVRADAIAAVKREASTVFKRRDGKFVPLDSNGDVIYGGDGTSPMTPMEWIKTKLSVTAPFYFEASSGGGSGGSGGGSGGGDFSNLSPTERMRRQREQQSGR